MQTTIAARSFSYTDEDGEWITLARGDEFDTDVLTEEQLADAKKNYVFPKAKASDDDLDPELMDAEELAEYFEAETPNVSETVAFMTSPARAKIVLEAERIATGDEIRTGVLKAATKIIGEGT